MTQDLSSFFSNLFSPNTPFSASPCYSACTCAVLLAVFDDSKRVQAQADGDSEAKAGGSMFRVFLQSSLPGTNDLGT